jgi:hypothetical protein
MVITRRRKGGVEPWRGEDLGAVCESHAALGTDAKCVGPTLTQPERQLPARVYSAHHVARPPLPPFLFGPESRVTGVRRHR